MKKQPRRRYAQRPGSVCPTRGNSTPGVGLAPTDRRARKDWICAAAPDVTAFADLAHAIPCALAVVRLAAVAETRARCQLDLRLVIPTEQPKTAGQW